MTTATCQPDHERIRQQAQDAVAQALAQARRRGRPLALLLVDAADAGRIDGALGHAAGARTLAELEQRLRAAVPPDAVLARLTRERLAIAVAGLADQSAAVQLAQQLADVARLPLSAEQVGLRLDAAVGLALSLDGEGDAAALLRDADAAARRARAAGGRGWELADPGEHERALRRLRLEDELAAALARDQLALYFQPIISLQRGRLVGVEALVRWRHPVRGLLGPAQFLPAAEESGLIVELGDWMLGAICRQLSRWSASHPAGELPLVSLNVSGRELRDETFAQRFATTLQAARVPPQKIALEIAEPGVLDERTDAQEALEQLRGRGVRVVLDRFGGARSSLAHLAQLPIDGLKLDRSLLGPLAAPSAETAIAEAVVSLARSLGLSVTAPGIETERQLAAVRALHVDAAQGHLIARPAPASGLADLQELELDLAAHGDRGGAVAAEAVDELLPLSAVAEALGVSPSTVRRLADQGALPGTRTEGGHRRFRRSEVQRIARERRRSPALRPWELPMHPLPASAELLEYDGAQLVERAARALYDPRRPGWFAAPQGLARSRTWLASLGEALAAGTPREGIAATAAYADAAALGGASPAEIVRFLGQLAAVASHELRRARSGAEEEARGLQRILSAATEAFLERR